MTDVLLLQLAEGQKTIQNEVLGLRGDVRSLQADMKPMQADVKALRAGMKLLQDDVAELNSSTKMLEVRVERLKRLFDGQQAWFATFNEKFTALETAVNGLRQEVAEVRDLMAHLRDDDVVQRGAIANLSRDLDALRGAPAP